MESAMYFSSARSATCGLNGTCWEHAGTASCQAAFVKRETLTCHISPKTSRPTRKDNCFLSTMTSDLLDAFWFISEAGSGEQRSWWRECYIRTTIPTRQWSNFQPCALSERCSWRRYDNSGAGGTLVTERRVAAARGPDSVRDGWYSLISHYISGGSAGWGSLSCITHPHGRGTLPPPRTRRASSKFLYPSIPHPEFSGTNLLLIPHSSSSYLHFVELGE